MSKRVLCEVCNELIEAGDEAAQVREGECTGKARAPFRGRKVIGLMHRTCFLRVLGSPKAARTLLEEGLL